MNKLVQKQLKQKTV